MDTFDFDEFVDLLRQRLFDFEAVNDGGLIPNFKELMKDRADLIPEGWYFQGYDELEAQGHLDPNMSGKSMGGDANALLSAEGRHYIRHPPTE